MSDRRNYPGISLAAFEHPADHAALEAFRTLPGAAALVKRLAGQTTESAIRLNLLATSARASASQFAKLYECAAEAARILDISPVPETFVSLGSRPGAFSLGIDSPRVVVTSSGLDLWQDEELLAIVGREMGHILAGHAVYKTILSIIVNIESSLGTGNVWGTSTMAPLKAALAEWSRKSELSADRAGLLVTQNSLPLYHALMKSAAGPRIGEMDINEFFRQASDYETSRQGLDSLLKFIDVVGDSRPFASVRIAALQEWERGAYPAIIEGRYPLRGPHSSVRENSWEGRGADPGSALRAARDFHQPDSSSPNPQPHRTGKLIDALGDFLKGHGNPAAGHGRDSQRPEAGSGSSEKASAGSPHPESGRQAGNDGAAGEKQARNVEELLDGLFGKKE